MNSVKYKCVTNGFEKAVYLNGNPDPIKRETICNGDILECNDGYIVKDGIPLCHKDSIFGKYHFRKADE